MLPSPRNVLAVPDDELLAPVGAGAAAAGRAPGAGVVFLSDGATGAGLDPAAVVVSVGEVTAAVSLLLDSVGSSEVFPGPGSFSAVTGFGVDGCCSLALGAAVTTGAGSTAGSLSSTSSTGGATGSGTGVTGVILSDSVLETFAALIEVGSVTTGAD